MRVDCHIHVVAELDDSPQEPARTYTALAASVADLEEAAPPTDVDAFVVVQPSFYGSDHRVLLAALAQLGARGRGVAVGDPASTEAELQALFTAGVRGLRINRYSPLQSGGASSLSETVRAMADVAAPVGLHLEVMAPIEGLLAAGDAISSSEATIVVDHYGLFGDHLPTDPDGRALLDLLAHSHVFVKCSAPYRSSPDPLQCTPDPAWLTALLEVAPDRCVWGSDWPFTPPREAHAGADGRTPYRELTYESMFNAFVDAVGSEATLLRVFTDNPTRLYGFDDHVTEDSRPSPLR